jgi:hypothetical protein
VVAGFYLLSLFTAPAQTETKEQVIQEFAK